MLFDSVFKKNFNPLIHSKYIYKLELIISFLKDYCEDQYMWYGRCSANIWFFLTLRSQTDCHIYC